jgi:hypothetical protein
MRKRERKKKEREKVLEMCLSIEQGTSFEQHKDEVQVFEQ